MLGVETIAVLTGAAVSFVVAETGSLVVVVVAVDEAPANRQNSLNIKKS